MTHQIVVVWHFFTIVSLPPLDDGHTITYLTESILILSLQPPPTPTLPLPFPPPFPFFCYVTGLYFEFQSNSSEIWLNATLIAAPKEYANCAVVCGSGFDMYVRTMSNITPPASS